MIGIFAASHLRVEDPVAAVLVYADTDKIGGSYFADLLVDFKIAIRKKRKRNIVRFFEIADLESRIAGTDTHQFDLAFQALVTFNFAIHLIDRRSLPLAERSVHTEYLDNDNIGFYFRNAKSLLAGDSQIIPVVIIFGNRK